MSSINSIIRVTVRRVLGALARRSFGVAMIVHYHTKTAARVFSITEPGQLEDYGFLTTDPLYHAVNACFSQANRPAELKIGRRANAPSQTLTITVGAAAAVEGHVTRLTVGTTEIVRTVPAASTPTLEAAALVTLINGAAGGTPASSALGVITIATAANGLIRFSAWSKALTFKSTGSDPGLAADLNAIYAEDPGFTGFDLVHMNEAESKIAAAWAESNDVLFFPTFFDSEMRDTLVTTDAGSDLKALNYKNTHSGYSGKDTSSHWGIALFAWMGSAFLPGGETFAHKQLAGVLADTRDTLTAGELDVLRGKNVNVYFQKYEDRALTWEGVAADGRFIDSRRFLLWQAYDVGLSLFDVINAQPGKLPFTDDGRQALISAVRSSADRGVRQGGTNPDFPYTIQADEIASVSSADKAARVFPPMTLNIVEAGAIHATSIVIDVRD